MGKIGDLWVRLGLKKDDLDKGLAEAKGSVEGFGNKIKGLKNIASGVFAAIGVAAMAMAKDFVRHSQLIGDAWDNAMSRLKAGWGQFLTTLTSWDWDDFGRRMSNAMSAAGKSQAAHDAEFEVQNSIRLREAQMREELAELQLIMRDTRKSYEERAAAAKQYLDKVAPLYEQEIKYRERVRMADLNEYLAQAGVQQNATNRQMAEVMLTDVAPNEALMNALYQYNERNQGKSYKLTQSDMDMIDAFLSKYSVQEGAALTVLAAHYQKTGDDDAKKVVDAIEGLYAARAAFDEETRRIQTLEGNAEARSFDMGGINTSVKDDGLKQAEKILARAEDAARSEVEILTNKYNEEKALLEQYGMSTEALTQEYMSKIQDIIFGDYSDILDMIEDLDPIEFEPIDIKLEPDEIDALIEKLRAQRDNAEAILGELEQAITTGFTYAMDEMMSQLFELSNVNMGGVLQALLTPLADMAEREGEILIASGLGLEKLRDAFLNPMSAAPGAAIAAGAALVAIGAFAKAGLASLANGQSGSSSVASPQETASAMNYAGGVQDIELTVNIEGSLRGSDIVLAANKTQANWRR